MRSIADLIATLQAEKAATPIHNLGFQTAMGELVKTTARYMIATSSGNWDPLTSSTVSKKSSTGGGFGGDPTTPLYDTGEFYKDIDFTIEGNVTSVGTNLPYMKFVEMGTSHMPPRPIFRPAFFESRLGLEKLLPKIYLRSLK